MSGTEKSVSAGSQSQGGPFRARMRMRFGRRQTCFGTDATLRADSDKNDIGITGQKWPEGRRVTGRGIVGLYVRSVSLSASR